MPSRRRQAILLQLQNSLLQAGHAGENPCGNAVCRPEDDFSSSGAGVPSPDRNKEAKEKYKITKKNCKKTQIQNNKKELQTKERYKKNCKKRKYKITERIGKHDR